MVLLHCRNGHHFVYPQGSYRKDLTETYLSVFNLFSRGAKESLAEIKAHEEFGPFWFNDTVCYDVLAPTDPTPPGCRYGNVKWPVVESVGWWDIFQGTQLDHWYGISTMSDSSLRSKHVLIVGPMGHCTFGLTSPLEPVKELAEANAMVVAGELASEFFAGNLDGGHVRSRLGRVNFFLMKSFSTHAFEGAPGDYWVSGDDFPATASTQFFLGDKGSLVETATTAVGKSSYTYDPTSPTPMYGGNNLMFLSGMRDCGTAEMTTRDERDDVAVWTSEPLKEDLPVVGRIKATLFVSSSAVDTDFVVTVEDVCKETLVCDSSMLVRYGMQRMRWREGPSAQSAALVADQVYEITVDLWTTAYIFPKEHRIRVTVASAAYPYYDANPNTGDRLNATVPSPVAAQNTVHFAPQFPSRLTLPVASMDDLVENKEFGPTLPVFSNAMESHNALI